LSTPARFLLYTDSGFVVTCDVVMDHWAVDAWGIAILCRDVAEAFAAAADRRVWSGADNVEQPIDVARWELETESGAAFRDCSLAYWSSPLRTLLDGHEQTLPRYASASTEPSSAPRG
jgi:hypothetical protein